MNIGGAMTAPFIVVLTAHYGWQGALLWIALPAVLLTATWAWYGRDRPAEHPRVTAEELADLDASDMAKPAPMTLARMRQIVGQRDVRLLTFSYFCLNYVFYLLGTLVVPVPGAGAQLHRSRERLRRHAAVDRRRHWRGHRWLSV